MKSNNTLFGIALLCLLFAVTASATAWGEIASAIKIAMFALGFGSGVGVGTLITRRSK